MKDKVVIITGASAGIGEALATTLVHRGAKGVVLAARRESELAALAKKLGPTTRAVVADVSVRADNEKLVKAAIDAFGQLDVFVANAGRGISRTVAELTDEDVDQMITTNFKSVLYGIQASLPHFKQQKRGQFIAVSSMLARLSFTNIRSAYSASKAAVNSLMSSLRVELKTEFPHIIATTVMPGVVATGFGTAALNGGMDSRTLPGAQPVEEVGTVIADAIETPRAEVYTRPQMREIQAKYYTADDVATVEAGFGMPPR
ncbi:MAG TPA: SDR family oxidoreductase [Kofleriaceae bacterium]|jgi:NADP-dependent 3-hydroxy acid dehydrogenase YdfG